MVSTANVRGTYRVAHLDRSEERRVGWANTASFLHGGTFLYCWPQPFGPALADSSWCSAGRVFDSFRMHFAQTTGVWPSEATYRPVSAWLPPTAMSFSAYVSYLSQRLLGIPADARIAAAGVAAVPDYANATVSATSPLPTYILWRLMIAILDSPDHMTR